jgi:hypothetical protein
MLEAPASRAAVQPLAILRGDQAKDHLIHKHGLRPLARRLEDEIRAALATWRTPV